MSSEKPVSGWIHILVAIIGLLGALGVAWITTQTKFAQELDSKASDIAQLKAQLDGAEKRLTQQQQDMDRKVAAVDERLKKLDMQIELAQAAASNLRKLLPSFGREKK